MVSDGLLLDANLGMVSGHYRCEGLLFFSTFSLCLMDGLMVHRIQ